MIDNHLHHDIFEQNPKEPVEHVSVWIVRKPQGAIRFFFCNVCRSGLFKYQGMITSIIPGDPDAEGEDVTQFPYYVRCYGNSERYGRCPMGYIVQGFVEPGH